jgi:hypothetical protein
MTTTNLKSIEGAVILVWLCIVVSIFITMPDNERYQGRVERMERLLRTHCSGWSLVKDADYVPIHELLVIKCLPK